MLALSKCCLALALSATSSAALQPHAQARGASLGGRSARGPALSSFRRCNVVAMAEAEPPPEPGAGDDLGVDWDNAWKKELESRQTGVADWRPEGRAPVSEQAVVEAQLRRGADQALDTAQVSLNQWTGKWQFWVFVLAAVSVATTLASHGGGQQAYMV